MNYLLLVLAFCLSWGLLRFFQCLSNRDKSSQGVKLPPGPRPLPVIGNFLELGSLPHRSLTKLADIYGPIMSLKLGSVGAVVISSASMAREILQTHDVSFNTRFIPDALTIFDHHELGLIFLPVSPLWRNMRRVCNVHLFTPRMLDSNKHIHSRKIKDLLGIVEKCCETGCSVDIGEAAYRTALDLLGSTIYSMDLDELTAQSAMDFKESLLQAVEEAGKPNLSDYFPTLKVLDPLGLRRRTAGHVRVVLDIFDWIFNNRLQARLVPNYIRKNDMLESLLDLNNDEKEGIDLSRIKHMFLDLFIGAGHTIQITLEWSMTELLRNPDKMSKAQAELEQVIGKGNPVMVEPDIISQLPYLQAVIKETLRMHPSFPMIIPRVAGATVQAGNYTIPEGALILVNAWAIGRDPTTWKYPNEFIPERFLGLDIDVKGQHFELLPFGGGRRICPGLPLAMRMLQMMLGSLLNCFDWKPENGMSPESLSMEERFGIATQRAQPLRAIPRHR